MIKSLALPTMREYETAADRPAMAVNKKRYKANFEK